jgi:spore coat polysaccharide biosynthesis predicted glycosyltransferase SpsG
VEMLDCHPKRQKLLRSHTDRLVVVDDLMDHRFDADLVICGQSLPHYGNIAISHPETRFLTGYDYFIFSPAYRDYAGRTRRHREAVAEVLVAFGGGRYDVAYLKAATALKGFPDIRATFILGFAAEDHLKQELAEILPGAVLLGGVEDMPERLESADLAVVSAGYLKLEAAMVGTPVVMVATQWHQMPLAEEFTRHTGTPYAGYMGFATPETLEEAVTELLPVDRRAALAEKMRAVVDGKGIERVYGAVFSK